MKRLRGSEEEYRRAYTDEVLKIIVEWDSDRVYWLSRLLDILRDHEFDEALEKFEGELLPKDLETDNLPPIPNLDDYNPPRNEEDDDYNFIFLDGEFYTVDEFVEAIFDEEEDERKGERKDEMGKKRKTDDILVSKNMAYNTTMDFDDDINPYGSVIIVRNLDEEFVLEIIEKLERLEFENLRLIKKFVKYWNYYSDFRVAKEAFYNRVRRTVKRTENVKEEKEEAERAVVEDKGRGHAIIIIGNGKGFDDYEDENFDSLDSDDDFDEKWWDSLFEAGECAEIYEIADEIDWDSFNWDERRYG